MVSYIDVHTNLSGQYQLLKLFMEERMTLIRSLLDDIKNDATLKISSQPHEMASRTARCFQAKEPCTEETEELLTTGLASQNC